MLPGSGCIHPNLDRFAAEAVTFNSAYCPAPHCCPARASFMTGLYPSEHGVYNNVMTNTAIHTDPFPGTAYFSQALRRAGYELGYAGKWHVGRNVTPEDAGWSIISAVEQEAYSEKLQRRRSKWAGAESQNENSADRKQGEILRPDWGNEQLYRTLPDDGPKGYEHSADYRVVHQGMAGLKRIAKGGKPWCVMVSNSGGHDTYDVPHKFVEMYRSARIELPPSFRDTMDDKPRVYQRMRYQYWSQMSDDEYRETLIHYYAKLTMQDALFGELLKELDETGQADNTIVIFVSDHGDYHAAHGLWMKGVPSFKEAYNIPCIIRWPRGAHEPGRQVDALVSTVDFAPTILEAAGAEPIKPMSGKSLLPWIQGQMPGDWRTAVCSQMNGVELYYTQRIVMSKDYKYVYNGFDYDELYDLRRDPHEMHNLAFPDFTQKAREVEAGTGLKPGDQVPWPPLPSGIDEVRRKMLAEMWKFAGEHNDIIFNPYGTVALAPYGPALR
jgi:arylsulfatase A-like enzyme